MRLHPITHVSALLGFAVVAASVVLVYAYHPAVIAAPIPVVESVTSTDAFVASSDIVKNEPKLGLPLQDALLRVTKKTFGMEIHPATSPVPNDRFDGYHVGVDFETFENEQDIPVVVSAICDGPLLLKEFAKGYGGVAVQTCTLDGEAVDVLYGHLNITSVEALPKQEILRGQKIGILGQGYSAETDGVRKHLHLGLHRGSQLDIRGYVKESSEISGWLDVLPYLQP